MLNKLFGKNKTAKVDPHGIQPLPSAIAQSISNVVGTRSIPPMPGAAQKAFTLSTNPNAEARDFVEVIESDEALSARVIKIANSVFYDRGSKPDTIEAAVTVIGLNELRGLLSATSLSEIFPSKHPLRNAIWTNDIATALTARTIARQLAPQMEDSVFLAGLMHDVGKLLLLQRCPEEYVRVVKIVESEGVSFIDAETRRFPFSHTEVGQLIAEQWHFGPELTKAIRLHHEPWPKETDINLELHYIIKAADMIAHSLGLGHPNTFQRFRNKMNEELSEAWAYLKIQPSERPELLNAAQKAFTLECDLYNAVSGGR
jgi:HD-like signal output (HDOD) protein